MKIMYSQVSVCLSVQGGEGYWTMLSGPQSLLRGTPWFLFSGPFQGVTPIPVTGPVQSPVPGPAGGYPSQDRGSSPRQNRWSLPTLPSTPGQNSKRLLRIGRYASCGFPREHFLLL